MTQTDVGTEKKKRVCGRCTKWMGTPSFYLIINFLLSQWGDWMWQFSVGVYLSELSDRHLRLAAIFGFIGGGCVLLFGGIIGDWVDRNGRLKVVRISLFIQNTAVALSALGVCVAIKVKQNGGEVNPHIKYSLEAWVVCMAVVAQLGSVAYKIAIEKDWIVVIAHGNTSALTNLNAITRSLDLACKIVSPMTVGYIMTSASTFVSAVVLAVWNVASVFVEYSLLVIIYNRVPALATKGGGNEENNNISNDEMVGKKISLDGEAEMMIVRESGENMKENVDKNGVVVVSDVGGEGEKSGCCGGVVGRTLRVAVSGWQTYARQNVVWAGVALACLYMTVLGFDAITVAYIIANDISAFLVGVSMGMAGLTGIIGAFMFSKMAKRYGLEKTGVFSFSAEVLCLTLAVASVWTPGTKFNPSYHTPNITTPSHNSPYNTSLSLAKLPSSHINEDMFNGTSDVYKKLLDEFNETIHSFTTLNHTNHNHHAHPTHHHSSTNISMILLLVGIILSRIGLWMSDLVVTQLLQEQIKEGERGVVNGVQNSLNMLMEMFKFSLVILLPSIHLFGIHILLSFSFVTLAMFFFFFHSFKSPATNNTLSRDAMVITVVEKNEGDGGVVT